MRLLMTRFSDLFKLLLKSAFSIGLILTLSGFGTQAQVAGWTDFQICKASVIPQDFMTSAGNQEVFNQLKTRSLDCSIYMPLIMTEKSKKEADSQRDRENVNNSSGACLKNMGGQLFCAPPGGSALKDLVGQIVCGPGQCVVDNVNQIKCSTQEGGSAGLNYGQAVCIGGCIRASTAYCQRPTR